MNLLTPIPATPRGGEIMVNHYNFSIEDSEISPRINWLLKTFLYSKIKHSVMLVNLNFLLILTPSPLDEAFLRLNLIGSSLLKLI